MKNATDNDVDVEKGSYRENIAMRNEWPCCVDANRMLRQRKLKKKKKTANSLRQSDFVLNIRCDRFTERRKRRGKNTRNTYNNQQVFVSRFIHIWLDSQINSTKLLNFNRNRRQTNSFRFSVFSVSFVQHISFVWMEFCWISLVFCSINSSSMISVIVRLKSKNQICFLCQFLSEKISLQRNCIENWRNKKQNKKKSSIAATRCCFSPFNCFIAYFCLRNFASNEFDLARNTVITAIRVDRFGEK